MPTQFITPHDPLTVWIASLSWTESELALGYQQLSPKEQERADRFQVSDARKQYIASHATLRYILSQYLNILPTQLIFSSGEHGKPFLPDHSIKFNLSHAGEWALVAVSPVSEVGVDIEKTDRVLQIMPLAERFFAPGEVTALKALPTEEQANAFFRIWVRKEAYLKALGVGLFLGLDQFEVSLAPQGNHLLLHSNHTEDLEICALKAPIGYEAAVSCSQKILDTVNSGMLFPNEFQVISAFS
jgi:4'-phosphopantetheinyl transferase